MVSNFQVEERNFVSIHPGLLYLCAVQFQCCKQLVLSILLILNIKMGCKRHFQTLSLLQKLFHKIQFDTVGKRIKVDSIPQKRTKSNL